MGSRIKKRSKAERKIARLLKRARRQKEFLAQRIEKDLAFTEILPQPEREGDRCWKCGFVLVCREVKRTKRPARQQYAYHRFLHCGGCKRNYFFDRDKYWIDGRPEPKPPEPLTEQCDRAIAADRTGESFARRLQRAGQPRLVKREEVDTSTEV